MITHSMRLLARKFEFMMRILASRALLFLYKSDLIETKSKVEKYWSGCATSSSQALTAFEGIKKNIPDLSCDNYLSGMKDAEKSPFVYEHPDAPHLKKLRDTFGLEKLVAGAANEYEAMIVLGTWLGSRWDHGKDPIPSEEFEMDIVGVIQSGMQGKRYWCEIAAKVAVQAFSSLGWLARLTTTSRDGYSWEHAIVEVWSSQFAKWFALDTDFNVVFENDGIPLSAFELCHDGLALDKAGNLKVRPLGDPKPSLPPTDLLPFLAYIHIDLRSDWHTRKLRLGSPAGGDLATWWTARPDFSNLVTPKIRIDDRGQFDWPVNMAWVVLDSIQVVGEEYQVHANLRAYSPHLAKMQASIDGGPWKDVRDATLAATLEPGRHSLAVRVIDIKGGQGMSNATMLSLPIPTKAHAFSGRIGSSFHLKSE